jgi:tetratricopeptide (TPR) repeat protein
MSLSSVIAFFDPFGAVPGSSLNWSQQALLEKSAAARPQGPVIDTGRICRALESVGQNVAEVVRAIDWLVADLDLRLDAQAELLNRQVDLLAEIAHTLRSPARTRAAERLSDAAELLRHHRNERALSLAEQAIDDDPNNDTAFVVAAWAAVGLEDLARARGYFREAAQATRSEPGAGVRHMNAVFLAARLTFALDGPEAALRELDGAEPFIDPGLQEEHPGFTAQQLHLLLLSPNKAAAVKFDRAVYYTASDQMGAALEAFREVCGEHDIRFCLMTLTDPVLTAHEAVVDAAMETLRAHQALVDEVEETLSAADERWQALQAELPRHGIRNAEAAAATNRFGDLFTPASGRRGTLDETWPWPPNRRWLEEFCVTLRDARDFEEAMCVLIAHERMREAALETGIQELLLREQGAYIVVDRTRTAAVVGRRALLAGYDFRHISVDDNGQVTIIKTLDSPFLIRMLKEARKKKS